MKKSPPKILERGALRFRVYTQRRPKTPDSGPGTRDSGLRTRDYYTSHVLSYRLNGRRHRIVRAAYADLIAAADAAAAAITNGQTDLLDFTHTDKALLQRLRELARGCHVPLEILVAEAVEARARNSRANIVPKLCPEIVVELLEAKRAESAGLRWIEDLESRLNRFAREFPGPLARVRAEEIRTWLARLNLSKRSWNNNRTALLALTTFATERKYLPPDWAELVPIKPHRIEKEEEELYAPEELRALLFTAEKSYPQHLPSLAIMALAGCRHSELRDATAALDWRDVHFPGGGDASSPGTIHIRAAVAKSNTGRRYVPLQPALAQWLEPYAKPRGPVAVAKNLTNALARIAARAGVEWKRNALRNSFISYRCAVVQNVAQVAAEAGNSVGEIHKSYRKEITPAEGARWFAIVPTKADILPLFAHARL